MAATIACQQSSHCALSTVPSISPRSIRTQPPIQFHSFQSSLHQRHASVTGQASNRLHCRRARAVSASDRFSSTPADTTLSSSSYSSAPQHHPDAESTADVLNATATPAQVSAAAIAPAVTSRRHLALATSLLGLSLSMQHSSALAEEASAGLTPPAVPAPLVPPLVLPQELPEVLIEPAPGDPSIPFPAPSAQSQPPTGPDLSGATAYTYPFASDIPHNLKVKQYFQIVQQNRPPSWQLIALQLKNGEYLKLSQQLTQVPFADLRQAALLLPWALLQSNEFQASADCRKAYNAFDGHVQDLEQVADAAYNKGAEPERVQQAFILMSASMDQLIATVPVKYLA